MEVTGESVLSSQFSVVGWPGFL